MIAPRIAAVSARIRVRFGLTAAEFTDRVAVLVTPAADSLDAFEAAIDRLSLDDLYLATACSRGDEAAWKECAEAHFNFIRQFARRSLREPWASDVGDAVIAELWTRDKMARYEGRSTLRTWFAAVVSHAAINASDARRRFVSTEGTQSLPEPIAPEGEVPGAAAGEKHLSSLFMDALGELDADEKLLLLMYYEQDLTLEQLSKVFHASKPVLSRRLKRAREELRGRMDRLAQARFHESIDALRAGVDLGSLEVDLRRALRSGRQQKDG